MEKRGHGIEVCLAVYKRGHRMKEITDDLKKQTNQDFNLNIWNNSGEPLEVDFPRDRLRIVNSEKNIGPVGIFRLAKESKGEIIIFFDDDEKLDADFIEYNAKMYDENLVQGWFTRIFIDENSYGASLSYKDTAPGEEVDYVGTGGMVVGRKIFDEEPSLQTIPRGEEFFPIDLYLCFIARMRGMEMKRIEKKLEIISDDDDTYLTLGKIKDKSLQDLRKMGYTLLNDNCSICGYKGKFTLNRAKDEWHPIGQYICPRCSSVGRHRLVWDNLGDNLGRVLHVSPEKCFPKLSDDYVSCDFPPREAKVVAMADKNVDLTKTDFNDNEFDTIIANHVIDYIKEDEKAIREIARILKPGGRALITVPIYKEEGTQLMGKQCIGHWWRCGLDYIDKFRKYFKVEVINDKGEYLIICKL